MGKPVRCRVRWHKWVKTKNADGDSYWRCARCGEDLMPPPIEVIGLPVIAMPPRSWRAEDWALLRPGPALIGCRCSSSWCWRGTSRTVLTPRCVHEATVCRSMPAARADAVGHD